MSIVSSLTDPSFFRSRMVFYFTSTVVNPPDVWFHVDKLSSAHVYLRLREGQGLDDIPPSLVKANSISGNKLNDIDIVYTLWSNLHKNEAQMKVGQVGFHKDKE
ncbi:Coiled-coil domain-containing protein 25, partial [Caligus rogercresseyi]